MLLRQMIFIGFKSQYYYFQYIFLEIEKYIYTYKQNLLVEILLREIVGKKGGG
jgi:hypothetical protein